VIPIYEAGEADGLVYIAMRLVAGTDLRELLAREGPIAPERALSIVGQAASALDAAHARGLLHRDVKPGNILLAPDQTAAEHVYLSDFGLAVSGDAEGALDGGGFQGTAEYAAPEQIEGRPEARSDVYSLACLLYECLAGEPPFGRRRRLLATLWAHLHEDPPPLSERRRGFPPRVDSILAAALAKAPAERPATAGELTSKVRDAFGLEPSPWSRRRRLAFVASVVVSAAAAAVAIALGTGVLSQSPAAKANGPTISTFAGTGRRADLADPVSIAIDRGGNVYVGEEGSHRVRRIGSEGTIRTVAGPADITVPVDLQIGPDGRLYILEHQRPAVRRLDSRGRITTVAGTGQAGYLDDDPRTVSPHLCARPLGLALDPDGAIHVACPSAHRVIRVEADGSFTTVAGSGEAGYAGDGGPATEAALNGPQGIAFDEAGNLYIAEELNHTVRKVDSAGTITTVAGTGRPGRSADGWKASTVELWNPVRVAVDSAGSVYIMEWGVSRLRKVNAEGFIRTVAGTGAPGFSGDGGPATRAQLAAPTGFALDGRGDIYIADRNNNRVRKITAAE
jgi:sugar lactone lactonase YvrE